MAAEEVPPQSRSSSRGMRAAEDMSSSEARSFFSNKSSKKSQQKLARDKLVWFSPVHSPLLSPAREKTHQTGKKKVRQNSIFSIQIRGKGSLEGEEPTSPKVSCMGQVRAHKRDKDPFAEAVSKKSSQSKPGSMSPARFFTSPGRPSKWGSLFGSRKDSGSATPSSSTYGEGEVSCFGWPFESRSALQTDKTCDFLARSLDLFQERGSSSTSLNAKPVPSAANVPGSQLKKQGSIRAATDRYVGVCTPDEVDLHSYTSASDSIGKSVMEEDSAYGVSMASLVDEKQHGGKKPIINPDASQLHGLDKSLHEDCSRYGKPPASKQRLIYEELPSLHCGASSKQSTKISMEVVPETWLWRDGERLRPDGNSHLSFFLEKSVRNSREDLEKSQQDELNLSVSPPCDAQPCTMLPEVATDHQILHAQLPDTESRSAEKHMSTENARLLSIDGNANIQDGLITESGKLHINASPYSLDATQKEKRVEFKSSPGSLDLHNGVESGKQQLVSEPLQTDADVEKYCNILKSGHQIVRRVEIDVGKENYTIALPPLLQKNLSSLHSKEESKRSWSIFKTRKSEALSVQPFSALIWVGYNQSAAPKDVRCKDEELLKGILEVGRLSFQGSGKYFQVLNSDAAFNRSRSATSHRTVIRLQRCNSDPCRSLC